jgi:hypothetical protein
MNRKLQCRFALFLLFLIAFLPLLNGEALAQSTETTVAEDLRIDLPPLCRFGVNVSNGQDREAIGIESFDTRALRLGWYINYEANINPSRPNGAEYSPMIRVKPSESVKKYRYSPSGSTLLASIAANPGAIWLIGNEPDRIQYQDDNKPEVYASAYHELYYLIKAEDPSARIFAGSIVQATEIRLQYLDLILASYREQYGTPMPVDGWSIHGFILNEQRGGWGAEIPPGVDADEGLVLTDVEQTDDISLYTSHVINFRAWMKANGYRNTPLIMSEYGVLMPVKDFPQFNPGRVNAFMDATFDFLLNQTDPNTGYPKDNNKLVQRLSWYSTSDNDGFNGNLYDLADGKPLNLMGQNYARYAQSLNEQTDFFPTSLVTYPPALLPNVGNGTIRLVAEIANAGNNQIGMTVDAHFYLGDPDAGGTLIGTDTISLTGCGETTTAEFEWSDVPAGAETYDLFVRVEATEPGLDLGTNSPETSFKLFSTPDLLFLPTIQQ